MLYEVTVPTAIKGLTNLSHLFEKAIKHAELKKMDMNNLLQSRLIADQLGFITQVQIACDTAKLGASRLTGKDAPKHEDDEKTVAELQARIQSTIQYLKTFTAKDFAGAEDKRITTPRWEGKTLSGSEFAFQHVMPNFYFHVTTAYQIFRVNGVEIGKKDYLGEMPFKK